MWLLSYSDIQSKNNTILYPIYTNNIKLHCIHKATLYLIENNDTYC